MQYNQPYGVADPDAAYQNGNPSTGVPGSIPPAASIEYPQREIVNLIKDVGINPDNGDLHQLGRAIQSGNLIHAFDSGPINTLVFTLVPPIITYYDGLAVWVTNNITNDGPATVNISNLGARNIVRRGGAPLQAGDMPAGYKSLLVYSKEHVNFELYGINFNVGTGFLPILTANTVLYVDTTIGNDTLYDGTTAAVSGPHGPFKTIMRAINETFKYGPSIYTMTINVAPGNYPENVTTPIIVGPTVIINGAGRNSTVISGAMTAGYTVAPSNNNNMTIQNLCVKTNNQASGTSCCVSLTGANLTIRDCSAGGPGSATNGYIFDALGGNIYLVGATEILAGTTTLAVMVSFTGGGFIFGSGSINHLGTINCGVYATCSGNATMSSPPPGQGDPTFVNVGFVTGIKWSTGLNGVINTQGHSVNYFPGTTAGGNASGGQYN